MQLKKVRCNLVTKQQNNNNKKKLTVKPVSYEKVKKGHRDQMNILQFLK